MHKRTRLLSPLPPSLALYLWLAANLKVSPCFHSQCLWNSFTTVFIGSSVELVYPPSTAVSLESRGNNCKWGFTSFIVLQTVLSLFTQTSLSANPVLMQLSSFSLVWNLLRDLLWWIGGGSERQAWAVTLPGLLTEQPRSSFAWKITSYMLKI